MPREIIESITEGSNCTRAVLTNFISLPRLWWRIWKRDLLPIPVHNFHVVWWSDQLTLENVIMEVVRELS